VVGGSCPNVACLPSKNLIYAAKVAAHWRARSRKEGTHELAHPHPDEVRSAHRGP
jgi:pyruvate/2-oxoglutarate dehydrogenase complex dihydrolipoamide dehydrogenase (E3) component